MTNYYTTIRLIFTERNIKNLTKYPQPPKTSNRPFSIDKYHSFYFIVKKYSNFCTSKGTRWRYTSLTRLFLKNGVTSTACYLHYCFGKLIYKQDNHKTNNELLRQITDSKEYYYSNHDTRQMRLVLLERKAIQKNWPHEY